MDRGTVALLSILRRKFYNHHVQANYLLLPTLPGVQILHLHPCGKSDCSGTDEEQVPTGRICSTCEDLKNSQEN